MTIKSLPMNIQTKVYLFEDGSSMMRESSVNAWVLLRCWYVSIIFN